MKCTGEKCPIPFMLDVGECSELNCPHRTPPQTNGDRLRSLDNAQLAEILMNDLGNLFCKNKPECSRRLDTDEGIPDEWCLACASKWLESPAETALALPLDHEEKADSGLVTED